MPIFSTQTSIRKALTNAVMLVTALCLSLSISISTYLDVKEQKAKPQTFSSDRRTTTDKETES